MIITFGNVIAYQVRLITNLRTYWSKLNEKYKDVSLCCFYHCQPY